MGDKMKDLKYILIVLVIIYCVYWVFKTVSYTVFYESMVEDTVCEMLKIEHMKAKYKCDE